MLKWIMDQPPILIMMIIFLKNLLASAMAMLLGLGLGLGAPAWSSPATVLSWAS